jgi:probable rRNA maturation factor
VINVEIANEQSKHVFDVDLLQEAVRVVLRGESVDRANVSVAIVDDATMHVLNRKYLRHDYATDVLSFLLSATDESLDGEVIVSADTAASEAIQYAWSMADELLLYVIHGTLHLVGYDDASEPDRAAMRTKEREYLTALGRRPNDGARASESCATSVAEHPNEGETLS